MKYAVAIIDKEQIDTLLYQTFDKRENAEAYAEQQNHDLSDNLPDDQYFGVITVQVYRGE